MKTIRNLSFFILNCSLVQGAFTEPPAIIYGKINSLNSGTTHQVFDGTLAVTLTNNEAANNSVTLTTQLRPTGAGDAFSYRLAIPQRYLPAPDELGETLSVKNTEQGFRFSSITLNGTKATPLDSSQSLLTTSFSNRGNEHRLDLLASLPVTDTDGDGMPDWWEEQYGLNPLFAGDATTDLDEDGENNLTEFINATRPDQADGGVSASSLRQTVPLNGSAGLHFRLHGLTANPEDVSFSFRTVHPDLDFRNGDEVVGIGFVSYADLLAGRVSMEAKARLTDVSIEILALEEDPTTLTLFELSVSTFDPASEVSTPAAVWLTSQASGAGPDWADLSGKKRDGYQPDTLLAPGIGETGASFDGNQFCYLDERDFNSTEMTTFIAMQPGALTTHDQTLLDLAGTRLSIGGSDDPSHVQALAAKRGDQITYSPALPLNETAQVTLAGPSLSVDGLSYHQTAVGQPGLPQSFAAIGASRGVIESAASGFFQGGINEILVYQGILEPQLRSRIEDYQRSRWDGAQIWDLRNETAPLTITGTPGRPNIITTGWGNDTLIGSELDDVLRGGPGADSMNGGPGADRFQIFPGHGHDTITGFSEAEGDTLDLTAFFGKSVGTPDQFLTLRLITTRVDGSAPIASTVIEWNGGDATQSVTLVGLPLSAADLPRLTGSGAIRLGGPRYPMALELAATETRIFETLTPSGFVLERSGNTDGAASIQLSFLGTAKVNQDYTLNGVDGTGAVRVVNFAAGEVSRLITIQPVVVFDGYEKETIIVSVLPSEQATTIPTEPLTFTLEDPPVISATTLVSNAQRLGKVPGVIQFSRTGPLNEPLTTELQFGGTAKNGIDFEQISPALTFPAGVREVEVKVIPSDISPSRDRALLTQITASQTGLGADTFALPPRATVVILDAVGPEGITTFASWAVEHFPNNTDHSALRTTDSDGDFINNLLEYHYGTDPNVANSATEIGIKRFVSDGRIEIQLVTAAGRGDSKIELQHSPDLGNWPRVNEDFNISLRWLPDGRIERTYRSRLSAENLN